jgi:hypothetical protein
VPEGASPNGHAAAGAGRGAAVLSLPSLWVSIVVEEACLRIWEAWGRDEAVTTLRVSPDVYQAVAAARPGEVLHDYPLMLLGLPLVADAAVATYAPVAA